MPHEEEAILSLNESPKTAPEVHPKCGRKSGVEGQDKGRRKYGIEQNGGSRRVPSYDNLYKGGRGNDLHERLERKDLGGLMREKEVPPYEERGDQDAVQSC
jgi:hypothetical protein